MTMTRFRRAFTLALGVLFATTLLMSADAFAKKKKRKKGKKDADASAEVETSDVDSPKNVAREYYAKGKAFYEEGNYAEAEVAFQAAYDAKPHPTVLKSIAECQVQTGNVKAAIATLEKYLADPTTTDKGEVTARIDELKRTPSKVTVNSEPAGAKIALAGVDTGEVTPATLALNPGEYALTLSAEGFSPVQENIEVVLGEEKTITVNLKVEAVPVEPINPENAIIDPFDEEPTAMTEPDTEEMSDEEKSGPPNAFWALAAVAGAGLVSGTVFGTMALGDEEDYKKEPTQAKKEAGRRDAVLADVSFGIAGAAAIVGTIVLVVHHKKSKGESARRVNFLPVAGQREVGLAATVEF